MRRIFSSRVARYAMIYTGLFLASVILIYVTIFLSAFSQAQDHVDNNILYEADNFSKLYSRWEEKQIVADLDNFLNGHAGRTGIYLLKNTEGRILAGNLKRWPDVDLEPGQLTVFHIAAGGDGEEENLHARGTVLLLPGGLRLLVGNDYLGVKNINRFVRLGIEEGILMTMIMGLIVGAFMAWSLSRRLERINRTTLAVMGGGLGNRVPMTGSGDEFDRLAMNLNLMLDRIERLMESMEGVADVIAHDLRKPLNRLKSRMEVGLLSERSPTDCQTILAENVEDTDRILSTFNSLLTIAKVRASSAQAGFQTVDLAEVLRETGEFYTPVAEGKGQVMAVEAAGQVPVHGNPDLLVQAVFNLVDNAIKYSPAGAHITLTAEKKSSGCVVQIRDNGPGIPEHFLPRAYDRFARLDFGRESAGHGLGLSLVQVVMDLHGGTVDLADGEPGLVVRLEFPNT